MTYICIAFPILVLLIIVRMELVFQIRMKVLDILEESACSYKQFKNAWAKFHAVKPGKQMILLHKWTLRQFYPWIIEYAIRNTWHQDETNQR